MSHEDNQTKCKNVLFDNGYKLQDISIIFVKSKNVLRKIKKNIL